MSVDEALGVFAKQPRFRRKAPHADRGRPSATSSSASRAHHASQRAARAQSDSSSCRWKRASWQVRSKRSTSSTMPTTGLHWSRHFKKLNGTCSSSCATRQLPIPPSSSTDTDVHPHGRLDSFRAGSRRRGGRRASSSSRTGRRHSFAGRGGIDPVACCRSARVPRQQLSPSSRGLIWLARCATDACKAAR